MSAIATITTVLGLVPTILDIIKAVEAQIPETGKGKEKLEFLKNVGQRRADFIGVVDLRCEPRKSGLIGATVFYVISVRCWLRTPTCVKLQSGELGTVCYFRRGYSAR